MINIFDDGKYRIKNVNYFREYIEILDNFDS